MEREVTWKAPQKMGVLLISMLLLVGLLGIANKVNPIVQIPDAGLRRAVREKINRDTGPIYRTDLMLITELDASSQDIKSLTGIEYFKKLVVLNLENNKVQDLSPLTGLSMLKELNLRDNQITNLATVNLDQIAHLPLRQLDLSHNYDVDTNQKLSDITLISGFSQLERLFLRENQIRDISAVASLTNLQVLDIRENHVKNIEPLEHLSALQELNLRENVISDLLPLSDLDSLVYLNIHSNPIEGGLETLANLDNLQTLIMRNVYIGENDNFLRNLTQLQRVNLRNTSLSDVSVLVELMKKGALQDNAKTNIYADVNLLELKLPENVADPYQTLRPYWENIMFRYPIKLPYFPSQVCLPVFSYLGGLYEKSFSLVLSTNEPGGTIYYTLDGSEPSLQNYFQPDSSTMLYSGSITIENRTNEPNLLSSMQTDRTKDPFTPSSEVFKGSVIRAIVIDSEGQSSNVVTQTYFVDDQINTLFSIPILSLVTDAKGLFDEEVGIYVPGMLEENLYPDSPWRNPGNYHERGMKWERPVYLQMFSPSGDELIAMNAGVRIHGGANRLASQKSLRLYAREDYDEQALIQFDFFPALNQRISDATVDSFQTLILRNSGHDRLYTMFRDSLAQSLLIPTMLDIQGSQPVILFINGEYWGIHNVRTRYDEYYFSSYYGINSEDLVVLENSPAGIDIGTDGDELPYFDMLRLIDPDYAKNEYQTVSTLVDQLLYEQVSMLMDIDNFIRYNVSQIYFGNTDWPYKNIRFWRMKTDPTAAASVDDYGQDGKWRWMMLDLDFAFFDEDHETLKYATRERDESTFLLRSLLQNDTFKIKFINQFADDLNTIFREDIVINAVDQFEALYSPEVEDHIHRWGGLGGSLDNWLENVADIRKFALVRPTYQREDIIEYFDLSGTITVTTQSDPGQGHIRINSVNIHEGTPGVDDPNNWVGIYFQGVPIEITAIPETGYRFVRWEANKDGLDGVSSPTISLNSDQNITIKAVFAEE